MQIPLLGVLSGKKGVFKAGTTLPSTTLQKVPWYFFYFCPLFAEDHPHITPLCKQNNLSNQQYTIALGKNVRNSHRMDIKFRRKIVRKYYYSFFDLINQKIKWGVRPILLESCHIFDVYMSILYF